MTTLFLDTYYVDGVENAITAYDFFKDIIIPVLAGLAFPGILFFMTVWMDHYKVLLTSYYLREAMYIKIKAVIADIAEHKSVIQKSSNELNINEDMVVRSPINSKNTLDIYNLPFDKLIESFHNELNDNSNFSEDFTEFNNIIVSLLDYQKDYDFLCLENNESNLVAHNDAVVMTRDLQMMTYKQMNNFPTEHHGDEYFFWKKIGICMSELVSLKLRSDIKTKYADILKFIDSSSDPDFFPETFHNVLTKVIDRINEVENNTRDLKSEFASMISLIDKATSVLEAFLPKVRVNRPNKAHFWKYFSSK